MGLIAPLEEPSSDESRDILRFLCVVAPLFF
jgi:hypothetical protein